MRERLVRLYRIVTLLSGARYGLRTVQLAEKLEVSRATVDRDLAVLRSAGCAIETELVNGEARHRFSGTPPAPLKVSTAQVAALALARIALAPLEGTRLVRELDGLLKETAPKQASLFGDVGSIGITNGRSAAPEILRALDGALANGKRLRLRYRAASHNGREQSYEVDPIALRLVGNDLYLGAVGEHDKPKTFKVTRISQAEYLKDKARHHPEVTEGKLFHRALKAWHAEARTVLVQLASDVAWLAGEYPLARDQVVDTTTDGSALIRAEVAGLIEAKQWVLRWGSRAMVLEPPELRDIVCDELRRAAAQYDRPGVKRTRVVEQREAPGVKAARVAGNQQSRSAQTS